MCSRERFGARIPKEALLFVLWWAGLNGSWWGIRLIDVSQPVLLSLCFGAFSMITLVGGSLVAVYLLLRGEGAAAWVAKWLIAFLFVVMSFLITLSVLSPPLLQGVILVAGVAAVLASGLLYWRMRKTGFTNQEG